MKRHVFWVLLLGLLAAQLGIATHDATHTSYHIQHHQDHSDQKNKSSSTDLCTICIFAKNLTGSNGFETFAISFLDTKPFQFHINIQRPRTLSLLVSHAPRAPPALLS